MAGHTIFGLGSDTDAQRSKQRKCPIDCGPSQLFRAPMKAIDTLPLQVEIRNRAAQQIDYYLSRFTVEY